MILVTGVTGYVGGILWRELTRAGREVRGMTRKLSEADSRIVAADVLRPETLAPALEGVSVAYYLIHSMGAGRGFEELDRIAARNFGDAAMRAGVERIIYLGGLGESAEELSPHLRSRQEAGEILRESGVKVIEFRASIVLGPGSLSFEMIRALVERLPVMVAPKWVSVPAQPIGIEDLVDYLVHAASMPLERNHIFEIGGADQVSYGGLMREYARQRGLRRWIIKAPVLTPYLSSLWLRLVTPLYAEVGRKLIDSIRHPTVVSDRAARFSFPIRPAGYREAIAAALQMEDEAFSTPGVGDPSAIRIRGSLGHGHYASRLIDMREVRVSAPAELAFRPILCIGGRTGWYYGNWMWRLRGWMDQMIGGPGMARGRKHPDRIERGDALDCWSVEQYDPPNRLYLRAEMKLPGRAWLEFLVMEENGESVIRQTAIYDPRGLLGRAYWYLVYPLHGLVFAGMLAGIARAVR